MTKNKFRIIDLIILTVIASVIEGVNVYVSSLPQFFLAGFTVSFITLLALIAIYRWNLFGAIIPLVSSIVTIFIYRMINASLVTNQFIITYVLGHISVSLVVIWFKFMKKEVFVKQKLYLILYVLSGYLTVTLVMAITNSIAVGENFFTSIGYYLSRQILNAAFGTLMIFLASKQKGGIFSDMDSYLVRVNTVPMSAQIRQEEKNYLKLEELAGSHDVSDISLLDGGTLSEEQLISLNKTYKEMEGEKTDGKS